MSLKLKLLNEPLLLADNEPVLKDPKELLDDTDSVLADKLK